MQEPLCLDCVAYDGMRTIFKESTRAFKALKHPWLRDQDFISSRVRRAITSPSFVYRDYNDPETRRAFYCFEFKSPLGCRYTKVVVRRIRLRDHWEVVTVYRPNSVKERDGRELLHGKDDECR